MKRIKWALISGFIIAFLISCITAAGFVDKDESLLKSTVFEISQVMD